MNRFFTFVYGTASYLVFLATFLYAIGFIGNLGVPKSLDTPASAPCQTALWLDLGLLSLFAVQHSVMARPAFKRLLTKVVPVSYTASWSRFVKVCGGP
jgi:protein-S-isoprenylcysteine O-methyltransferase Ste14